MRPVLLINAVGLTARQVGPRTPELQAIARRGSVAPMRAILPAVTLSAQATMLTGTLPSAHGVVGNGWYWPELGEVLLWRQPNALVGGEKLYERARRLDPSFTCAKLFWWFNMGAAVEWALTPRPFYPADGRKIPAVQGWPADYAVDLERALGPFPFFDFWGPKAGLASSAWLAHAAAWTLEHKRPTLTMVYLPHLDYEHQRVGPGHPRAAAALEELDQLVGELARAAERAGAEIAIVSEYGLEDAERPILVNRALRRAGLLAVRDTPVGEALDPVGSRAFAVADHQVAHVVCADAGACREARAVLESLPGVARVLGDDEKRAAGLDHPRAGALVAVAARGAWFAYPFWLDDARAPDYARTVDIHRKPGYDPCELFVDPRIALPKLRVARRLAQKLLGFRYLMDVIPLDATLVKGTHGRIPDDPLDGPLWISSRPFERGVAVAGATGATGSAGGAPGKDGAVAMTSVPDRVLALLQRG